MLLALGLETGCTDEPRLKREAVREALDTYLAERGACIDAASFEEGFPTVVTLGNMEQAELDLLVDVGLLTVIDTVATNAYAQKTQSRVTDVGKKYDLTELGERYHRVQRSPRHGEVHQLCYGQPQVTNILRISDPSTSSGSPVIEVDFTYAVQDIAEWATEQRFLQKHPMVQREINSPQDPIREDAVLVRTDDGWTHQALLPGFASPGAPSASRTDSM